MLQKGYLTTTNNAMLVESKQKETLVVFFSPGFVWEKGEGLGDDRDRQRKRQGEVEREVEFFSQQL